MKIRSVACEIRDFKRAKYNGLACSDRALPYILAHDAEGDGWYSLGE